MCAPAPAPVLLERVQRGTLDCGATAPPVRWSKRESSGGRSGEVGLIVLARLCGQERGSSGSSAGGVRTGTMAQQQSLQTCLIAHYNP